MPLLDGVLECAVELAGKAPAECRLREKAGAALGKLREARLGSSTTAQERLRSSLYEIMTALDNCNAKARDERPRATKASRGSLVMTARERAAGTD